MVAAGAAGAAPSATPEPSGEPMPVRDTVERRAAEVGAFLGGSVGMSLGVPTGAHLANGRRGDWLRGTVASLTVWGAGVGLMAAMGFEGPGAVVTFAAVPLGQLVAATVIERDTSTTEEDP